MVCVEVRCPDTWYAVYAWSQDEEVLETVCGVLGCVDVSLCAVALSNGRAAGGLFGCVTGGDTEVFEAVLS
jgi:hypothetical protein